MAENGNMQLAQAKVPFPLDTSIEDQASFNSMVLSWNIPQDGTVPQWWSKARDEYLFNYWKEVDQLKVAVTTFVSKTLSIPFSIQPRDNNIIRHVKTANKFDENLRIYSGTSTTGPLVGFKTTFSLFINDYLTQDNGAFLYIMGSGNTDEPLIGAPLGLMHLPANRCSRTSNPEFPVVYQHYISKDRIDRYAIHFTRLISMAHLPSSKENMNGVGLSPISCCLTAATELWNIYRYSEEKFGSRPARQILYAKTGATIENLTGAFAHWQAKMDNSGLSHFASTLFLAPSDHNNTLELDVVDLASTPDGFDRKEASMQDAALVAAAFGLDLLDLAMAFGIQGQTRANADVQTRKGRGKGPGQFLESFIELLNTRYLPSSLRATADNIDDDQDEQRAKIANERSQSYARQIQFGIRTKRSIRVDMLKNGELNQDDFEHLELEDGRLPSGISVMALFESDDKDYKRWLSGSETIEAIEENRKKIYGEYSEAIDSDGLHKMEAALSALNEKEKELLGDQFEEEGEMNQEGDVPNPASPSARSASRSELPGDEEEREIERDQLPDENQMKATRIIPDDSLGWQNSNVDPYSLSEPDIKRAIESWNENLEFESILDSEVI